jgi:hypothetical protein
MVKKGVKHQEAHKNKYKKKANTKEDYNHMMKRSHNYYKNKKKKGN